MHSAKYHIAYTLELWKNEGVFQPIGAMKPMKTSLSIITSFLIVAFLGGCAKNISSDQYSEDDVGSVKQTYRGVILSVRNVQVTGGDSLGDNTAGLVGGGVGGALLGSQLGKGRGSVVGGVLGAAAGALGGAFLEKKLKEQDGVEYTVELTSGRVMTVVQGPEPRLQPGQYVLIMVGSKGRSRVVADQSGGQSAVMPTARTAAPVVYVPAPVAQAPVARRQVVAAPVAAPVYVQQQPQAESIDDIDQGRDRYARDFADRTGGSRVIVQQ